VIDTSLVAIEHDVTANESESIAVWQQHNSKWNRLTISVHMTELGKSIEALRKRLGAIDRPLSYNGLARELTKRLKRVPAIAGSTVMKWESGETGHPDPWALIEMAALANVSVERFVLGEKAAAKRREAADAASTLPVHFGTTETPDAGDARKRGRGGN
jgi:DNA-binding transcriptional regulator YiaG